MKNQPKRAYPDWMSLTPERFHETIYHGDDNWYFYYNMDWESCLIYGMVLHNKDYQIEGGAPAWFTDYVENYAITPFDCAGEDITLAFYKKGWVRTILTFHLEDSVTENGMTYNVSAKIEPDPEFLEGKSAPGRAAVPQSVWMTYVTRHMERLKNQTAWNPSK